MEIAVYDTYVRRPDGSTAHFDILVPKNIPDTQVLAYGQAYLQGRIPGGYISTRECQLCHMEMPTPEVRAGIEEKGYFILEFEDIPAILPGAPTRRQLIEHIRARSEAHRFADFRGVEEEKLWAIVSAL